MGPFSPTVLRFSEARVSSGSTSPWLSSAVSPASRTSHAIGTPVASMTRRAASETSGPMPSPGMSVT